MSWRKKLLFGILTAALALAATEGLMRLFHLAPSRTEFIERGGRARFAGNDSGEEWAVEKPAGTFRIVIAGSSTSIGFPWQPRSTFGLRLQALLGQALPGRPVEVIHAGQMNASSAEVRETVARALRYRPDLVVVYSGQNVFLTLRQKPRSVGAKISGLLGRAALGRLLVSVVGGTGPAPDEQAGMVYPEPPPLGPGEFDAALAGYSADLAAIAADCRAASVPLVLSGMVYNLSEWPPASSAIPQTIPFGGRRLHMEETGVLARTMIESGQFQRADILENIDSDDGYAFATFNLGRARLGQLQPWQALPGSSQEAAAALHLFFRAASEEAKTVVTHRATPEVSTILREVSARERVWYLDLEREFLGESLVPGFDLFEDQCHPNLRGQQIIAHALFLLLRAKGLPAPAAEWRPLPAWDEAAFRKSRGFTDAWVRQVELTMGIFLGLKRDLPFGSREVRRRLRLAQDLYPADPFPALLDAIVSAHYAQPDPATALADYYHRDPQTVARLSRERLSGLVSLAEGKLRVMIDPSRPAPPLAGIVRRDSVAGGRAEPEPILGTSAIRVVFDLDRGGTVSFEAAASP